MTRKSWRALALVSAACIAIACKSSSTTNAAPDGTAKLDANGGWVTLTDGPSVYVPPGAVYSAGTLSFSIVRAASPAPSGAPLWLFGPENLKFTDGSPATVYLPVPDGATDPSVYWSKYESSTDFEALGGAVITPADDAMCRTSKCIRAKVTHFSRGFVGLACSDGASCTPDAAVCDAGVRRCGTGVPACEDTHVVVTDGTSCGTGQVCAAGVCIAGCVAGQGCPTPDTDPCRTYQTACDATGTQTTCEPAGVLPDGTSCGTQKACVGGACLPTVRTVTALLATVWWSDASTAQTATAFPDGTAFSILPGDGSTALPGTRDPTTGLVTVPGVPVGRYSVVADATAAGGTYASWQGEGSTTDDTGHVLGRADAAPATQATLVTLNLTGLSPWQAGADALEITCSNAGALEAPIGRAPFALGLADLTAGATAATPQFDWHLGSGSPLPIAAQGDLVYVHQLSAAQVASGPGAGTWYWAASKATPGMNGVTIADGATLTVDAPLVDAPPTGSVAVDASATAYEALDGVPTGAQPAGLTVYVRARPHLPYPSPYPRTGFPDLVVLGLAPATAEVNLGTLPYGEFLDPTLWSEVVGARYRWTVPITAPGASAPFQLETWVESQYACASTGSSVTSCPGAPATFAPQLSPPRTPTVASGAASIGWVAPAVGTATSYTVLVRALGTDAANATVAPVVARLVVYPYLRDTTGSVTIPAGLLAAGKPYVAEIIARSALHEIVDAPDGDEVPVSTASTVTGVFTP